MTEPISVFWFRRDLRLDDNAGVYHALRSGHKVLPVFIFDRHILDDLQDKHDKRVCFIYNTIHAIQDELKQKDSSLHVFYNTPEDAFKELIEKYKVAAVYTNTDYEPYAQQRDKEIAAFLKTKDVSFHTYKDQVIFEKEEILKDDKTPYKVYTAYAKRWRDKLDDFYLKPYPTRKYFRNFLKTQAKRIPSLSDMGFKDTAYNIVKPNLDEHIAKTYHDTRNTPGIRGTTRLGVHLRFGTASIRHLAAECNELNQTLLGELIWRDFFSTILWHFPHTVGNSFKPEYDSIKWRYDERDFSQWCTGNTGYPIVDAGMRELNETGFMHNRVRMITASFLCKHLLIDWRWGEAYFAQKLMDYDLSQNMGNWQWVAGCGVDASPYFRIFNPISQAQKFDKDHVYIKQWVPEYKDIGYRPMVDHEAARKRCLKAYSVVKEARTAMKNSEQN